MSFANIKPVNAKAIEKIFGIDENELSELCLNTITPWDDQSDKGAQRPFDNINLLEVGLALRLGSAGLASPYIASAVRRFRMLDMSKPLLGISIILVAHDEWITTDTFDEDWLVKQVGSRHSRMANANNFFGLDLPLIVIELDKIRDYILSFVDDDGHFLA